MLWQFAIASAGSGVIAVKFVDESNTIELGDESDIQYLDMALGAVHLKGVKIISKNRRYQLWIEDLRIGYNLANLIKSGFQPQKSPQDILFVRPRLTIFHIPKDSTSDTSSK